MGSQRSPANCSLSKAAQNPEALQLLSFCKDFADLIEEQEQLRKPDPEDIVDDSPSRLEWLRQKREQGARNKCLDELMCMVGLEGVKRGFLMIHEKTKVTKMLRLASQTRIDVSVVGNRGTGTTTVDRLYDRYIDSRGISGRSYTVSEPTPGRLTLTLPDYSDDELLKLFVILIKKKYQDRVKLEGGYDGQYLRMVVQQVGLGRASKKFRNIRALEETLDSICKRQVDRLCNERQAGKDPNCFLLTKDDLLGTDKSELVVHSSAWKELQKLAGLDDVKASVQGLFDMAAANHRRKLEGKPRLDTTLNRVFLGPPGTGKTTVGKLYGQILADLGLLSKGEVLIKNPSDFIAKYLGQSEDRTRQILEEARGNVLIIDDAYMLYPGSRSGSYNQSDSYRTAIIDTLVAEIQNVPGEDRCVILLGYAEEMEEMFQKANPGLARRFSLDDAFHFTNFTLQQLKEILEIKLQKQDLGATEDAKKVALAVLERASYRPNFGNGGEVENLLSHAKNAYQKRISRMSLEERPHDVVFAPEDFDQHHDRALHSSENCQGLFEGFVGHNSVISRFREYQEVASGMRLYDIDPRPFIPFTFIFKGPPGTGKTTTATKVGQIFYDIGLLSSPNVIECSASDLIAGYEGQTGAKVVSLLDRALGKVLFVDEAYRLGEGQYARTAAGELVDAVTKPRYHRKVIIILAGYEEDMNNFLLLNRGLRSRFSTDIMFRSMPSTDCLTLLLQLISKVGIHIEEVKDASDATRKRLLELFAKFRETQSWANGRSVEKLARFVITQTFKLLPSKSHKTTASVSMEVIVQCLEEVLLETEIEDYELAVTLLPENHSSRASVLNTLAVRLFDRYERQGDTNDLGSAIVRLRKAVAAIPENDDITRPSYLSNLGGFLLRRYEATSNPLDLEAAISTAEEAVKVAPETHPERATLFNLLGVYHIREFERSDRMRDLESAISALEEAVAAVQVDHPDRTTYLVNLSNTLSNRYERTANADDLHLAISSAEKAISDSPTNHKDRPLWLVGLGNMLMMRYDRYGETKDLDDAITRVEMALSFVSEKHIHRGLWNANLGVMLSKQFTRTGNTEYLHTAISTTEVELSTMHKDHPERAALLVNLSSLLCQRNHRSAALKDIDLGIQYSKMALNATTRNLSINAKVYVNLAALWQSRYDITNEINDLNSAVSNAEMAVLVGPEDHVFRAACLSALGAVLLTRSEAEDNTQDLALAIAKANEACFIASKEDPNWCMFQKNLGDMFRCQGQREHDIQAFRKALSCYGAAAESEQGSPGTRIAAARTALRIIRESTNLDGVSYVAKYAVQLLPLVCGRHLNLSDQQHAITQTSGLAADACSLLLKAGRTEEALQQLEYGRGLILGYWIDAHSDLTQLKGEHPELAEQYEQLRLKVSQRPDTENHTIRAQMIKDRRIAERELKACLDEIREKEGHGRFLCPPVAAELMEQAEQGPIVIVNVTDMGGDAIIVLKSEIRHKVLPDMAAGEVPGFMKHRLRRFRGMLEHEGKVSRDLQPELVVDDGLEDLHNLQTLSWLWVSCVKPILKSIEAHLAENTRKISVGRSTTSTEPPRIWWIGTGIASSLPFHAAGDFHGTTGEDALSRAVFSYTPTIKALIYSRACLSNLTRQQDGSFSVLVVAMPQTPGQMDLPGVDVEADTIKEVIGDTHSVTVLTRPAANNALTAMKETDIVHFATHGYSDPSNPSESHLLLQEQHVSGPRVDKLTIRQLSGQSRGRAQIAYLSACSTAEVRDTRFADEALHIASACQVAGFANVIGSLWAADDATCVEMARHFYEFLGRYGGMEISGRVVALALRDAVLKIRCRGSPSLWAPYIHLGA